MTISSKANLTYIDSLLKAQENKILQYHYNNNSYILQFILCIICTIISITLFAYVLTSIERHRNNQQLQDWFDGESTDDNNENNDDNIKSIGHDTILEVNDESTTTDDNDKDTNDNNDPSKTNNNNNNNKMMMTTMNDTISKSSLILRKKLLISQHLFIWFQVLSLTLLNYLLLVYLPGGNGILSFIAMISIYCLLFYHIIIDDIFYYKRYDRISILITYFLYILCFVTLSTYYYTLYKDGYIYNGSARIIGYDTQIYNNSDGVSIRSNLKVSWGSTWGCHNPNHYCVADLNGTLCSTPYNVTAIEEQDENNIEVEQHYEEEYDNEEYSEEEQEETYEEEYNDTLNDEKFINTVSGQENDPNDNIIYYNGYEEVDIIAETNGTDIVDVDYYNTKQVVQIIDNTNNTNHTNNNVTIVSEKFNDDNTVNSTTYKVNMTTTTNNNTNTNNTSQMMIVKEVNTTTKTNSSSNKNNGNHHLRMLLLSQDIQDTAVQVKMEQNMIDEMNHNEDDERILLLSQDIQDTKDEAEVEQDVINEVDEIDTEDVDTEIEYYNEIVDEVVDIEKFIGDEEIEDTISIQDLQQKHNELLIQHDTLQKENDLLKTKLNNEDSVQSVIQDEMDTVTSSSYDDDIISDDEYFQLYDWDYIWGRYTCTNLFTFDLEESLLSFNPNDNPNKPQTSTSNNNKKSSSTTTSETWPTIEIYGHCNTCTAYIQDYYSTQYYHNNIYLYYHQSIYYMIASFIMTIISCYLYMKHIKNPIHEHSLDLLGSSSTSNSTNHIHHHHNMIHNSDRMNSYHHDDDTMLSSSTSFSNNSNRSSNRFNSNNNNKKNNISDRTSSPTQQDIGVLA